MPAASSSKTVELRPIRVERMQVPLVGTSPLIVHRMTEKVRRQIEEKQQKKARQAKEARNPEAEYLAAAYVFPGSEPGKNGCRYGYVAAAFKSVAVNACTFIDGQTKVAARGSFHVIEEPGSGGLVPIEFDEMRMRTDTVTIAMGTRDLRYRPEFIGWRALLTIDFNANAISPEQIVNMYSVGGFSVGVGEWRPQRGGSYGMFKVQTEE